MPDSTPAAIWGDNLNLKRPYIGWLNHDQAGWQLALVYQQNGQKHAVRLGDPVKKLRDVIYMGQTLAAQTGTQLAGELSKRDHFLPLSMGGTP